MDAWSIKKLAGHCGARLEGVSLANASTSQLQEMRSALFEHGVIVMPEQHLSPDQHIKLAEFFGEINVITGKKVNNKLHTPLGDFYLNKKNSKENYFLVVRSEGIKIIKSTEDDSIISNKRNNLVKSPNNARIIEAKFLGGSTIVHLALNGMKDYDHLHIKIPGINYFENNQIVNLYTDVNYSYIF